MSNSTSNTDWIGSIAKRASDSEDSVRETMASYRISASPTQGLPRRLLLRRLFFTGEKVEVANAGPFEFSWDNLDHGLYALATERNLRGKSSVIEIIRWMLRGRVSDLLQADVLGWIKRVELTFTLDSETYHVRIANNDELSGSLIRETERGEEIEVAKFASSQEFELGMAHFFIRELSLDEVTNWTKTPGTQIEKPVVHSWPALAGVLYIGTEYGSLLGDTPVTTGLPVRLLQMFLGLPWVSTFISAKAAQDGAQYLADDAKRKSVNQNPGRDSRRIELEEVLSAKEALRKSLESSSDLQAEYESVTKEIELTSNLLRKKQSLLFTFGQLVAEAEENVKADSRELLLFTESKTAGEIFRLIEPSCCPRCEVVMTKERRTASVGQGACFVCGEKTINDSVDENREEQLKSTLSASRSALADVKSKHKECAEQVSELQNKYDALVNSLVSLDNRTRQSAQTFSLDIEIASLKGQLQELAYLPTPAPEETGHSDLPILNAIVVETEELMKERQKELLIDVSARILKYANQFGIENLSEAKLLGNLNLKLHKGGRDTSYSKTTPGEQLRLKVATVLALIGVAESKGIGRHPGVLLIDSLGAQEVTSKDFDELVTGLNEIAKEFAHLQIFVASRLSETILNHIPPDHLKAAYNDEALW